MSGQPLTTRAESGVLAAISSFSRHLRAADLSPKTIEVYIASSPRSAPFLMRTGLPQDVRRVRRGHTETWTVRVLDTRCPGTASVRYRARQTFWK
jgi:hypothetical protein